MDDFMSRRLDQMEPIGARMGVRLGLHFMVYVSLVTLAGQTYTRIEREDDSDRLHLLGEIGNVDAATAWAKQKAGPEDQKLMWEAYLMELV
ncbi:hypothetical protein CcrC1_gp436 [Caulobacter phage C1]|nr:hypothetical protein CcrC1_gp436 [Caulobacter phage C1]UTU08665.1 hypothetical protein CcrC2_gp437 [Caulobacter phage C2]UTU09743.1 hypothetical protein CcrBL47_gp459 [Caulobacter phage BL47]UTU10297.1 hypothetical protein CcrRB23_gp435 [Caulobacter phage RB23]WGN97331.1 hypothetical protein [Bertelyvirus sp.]